MPNEPFQGGPGDTVIAIPKPQNLSPLIHDLEQLPEGERLEEAQFKIRLANTEGRRATASYLVERRYAWRGYQSAPMTKPAPNLITLAAFDNDRTIATISVGTDSPDGLAVEQLYPTEVAALRSPDVRLCEFTKLAIEASVRSKPVLAALFHIAYIHARRINRCTDLVVEVNPRHVAFYERMLGFCVCGGEKIDSRVGAPAVLLQLELAHAERQIAEVGGHPELAATRRSLYPYFFAPAEEVAIERRLRTVT